MKEITCNKTYQKHILIKTFEISILALLSVVVSQVQKNLKASKFIDRNNHRLYYGYSKQLHKQPLGHFISVTLWRLTNLEGWNVVE